MNYNQVARLLEDIEYKPNFEVVPYVRNEDLYFHVVHSRIDSFNGTVSLGRGPERVISPDWTQDELVRAVFREILAIEEHEVREIFKYKGKSIFGPHINVDKLAEIV